MSAPDMAETRAPKVAVVGLGQMGKGIARNLESKALLVAVHDIEPGRAVDAGLSDHVAITEPAEIVALADIIVFAVPSIAQIEQFVAATTLRAGQILVDVTTSSPTRSRAQAAALARLGVGYVDAAMTGGAAGADAGTLTLMVGGEPDDMQKCQPVFAAISASCFHLGPAGSGQSMKLVHNLILHSSFLATCEGLRLAERAGIDPDMAIAVLNAGNARSFVTEVRFPRDILGGTMNARSRIANLEKDLGLALDLAGEQNARAPFGGLTRSVLAEALHAGHSETDFSWLFPLYEDLVDSLKDKT